MSLRDKIKTYMTGSDIKEEYDQCIEKTIPGIAPILVQMMKSVDTLFISYGPNTLDGIAACTAIVSAATENSNLLGASIAGVVLSETIRYVARRKSRKSISELKVMHEEFDAERKSLEDDYERKKKKIVTDHSMRMAEEVYSAIAVNHRPKGPPN
ncbi:hypothetical protein ACFL96_12855 [Thermoproteota archaeon]